MSHCGLGRNSLADASLVLSLSVKYLSNFPSVLLALIVKWNEFDRRRRFYAYPQLGGSGYLRKFEDAALHHLESATIAPQ